MPHDVEQMALRHGHSHCQVQAANATDAGMLQKVHRSLSAKAKPLLVLTGMRLRNDPDAHAAHELVPLQLQPHAHKQSLRSGSLSLDPLLQAGRLQL